MNSKDSLRAVRVDGLTYLLLAMVTAFRASVSSDEAAKYISPQTIFWCKMASDTIAAGLLALKMFRSEAFARYKDAKEAEQSTVEPVKEPILLPGQIPNIKP